MMLKIRKVTLLIAAVLITFLYFPTVHAAPLTAMSDLLTRMDGGVATNHTIKFTTPTGVAISQTITVTLPGGYTVGSTSYTDIDLSYGVSTGAETDSTLTASAPGAAANTWQATFSGQVLTLLASSTTTIGAGYKVIIEIGTNATFQTTGVNQIANNASSGTYIVSLGGTMADSGKYALVVPNDDQVTMTANVDPNFTFTLAGNASSFGAMTTAGVLTGGSTTTLTIGTNSNSGYTITVKDVGTGTVAGLYNSGTSTNIASASATLAGGTEGYGLQAVMSGAGSITAPYNVSGNVVGALQLTGQSLASYGTSTSANHTVTVTYKAAISASSKSGNYNDTLTYIATANF